MVTVLYIVGFNDNSLPLKGGFIPTGLKNQYLPTGFLPEIKSLEKPVNGFFVGFLTFLRIAAKAKSFICPSTLIKYNDETTQGSQVVSNKKALCRVFRHSVRSIPQRQTRYRHTGH